jgi:clan AA aspartic protease (TIGR02281 family)
MVFTDSPAQLENCTPIDKDTKPLPQRKNPRKPPRAQNPIRYQSSDPFHKSPAQTNASDEDEDGDNFEDDQKKDPKDTSKSYAIKLTKIGGSFVAQVRLNHSTDVHLIVDTGATMTVISYNIATELGLLSGSDNSINTVNTAGGSVQVSMAQLEHVQVGGAEAKHVAVAIHDLPGGISGVSGLLGMSFLNKFLVTLDAGNSLLHLKTK